VVFRECACCKKAFDDVTKKSVNFQVKSVFTIKGSIGSKLADSRRFLVTKTTLTHVV